MCLYLLQEKEIVPWAVALKYLSGWKILLHDTDLVPLLNKFRLQLIAPWYDKIGWEDTGTHMDK